MRRTVFVVLLFCLAYLWTMSQHTQWHENAHREITKHHGCVNISYQISTFSGNVTCLEYAQVGPTEDEVQLHNMNEIIGYNTRSIINTIFVLTGIVIVVLLLK